MAGAIGRQPADDADAPELGRVGVAAQLAQPRARTVEALHDRAVLVGHEDRARARGVRDGLREAQDARTRGGRLAQRRGLDVALRAGARARIAGREGGDDRGDGGDEQGTAHPRAVPVSLASSTPTAHDARNPRGDAPAAALARPGLQAPAARPHALAQPAQAVPGPVPCQALRVVGGIVDDLDVDRARAAAHQHVHRRPRGVAQRVGQALAHHAISRLDRRGGQPLARALQAQGDVEAGPGGPRDQLLDEREVGRVPDRVVVGQQRHELRHVALGLARGAGDGLEGLARQLRVDRRDPLAGTGLHDHHADRVRDDVVQLGGDPRALVADRERRELLALALELLRALGEAGRDEVALADRAAGDPGGADEQDGRHEPAVRVVGPDGGPEARRQQRDRGGHRDRRHRPAAGGEGVGADEDGGRRRQVAGRHERGRRGHGQRRGGHRVPAVEPQRGAERRGGDAREWALPDGGAGGPEEGRQRADQDVDASRAGHVTRRP